MDIALGAHYTDEDNRYTPQLRRFIDQLPDWSHTVTWSITYQSFVF